MNDYIKKITRKDVAKKAGVSEQTVSYVINGTRRFSRDVEKRVKKAVKDLNYEPNAAAKNLVTNKSYNLCVIVHDITNPIFNEIMLGFQEAAIKKNYIVTVAEGRKDINKYVNNLISRNFEGVFIYVLSSYKDFGFMERFLRSGVKLVLGSKIDYDFISHNSASVGLDYYKGMHRIVNHLVEKGHEKIVYLSGLDIKQKFDKRYQGFVDAYKEVFHKMPVVITDNSNETSVESGKKLAQKLLDSKEDFTAVVTTNDLMAYGVLEVMKANNINIPNDVSLVGIDDLLYSRYTSPKLTTLGFNKIQYGEKAFYNLYNQIQNHNLNDELCNTFIVSRESVSTVKK
ncbi:LacI family DNA-binding transcriptional regulator [Candidatus Izemoplasma sp. B36]|uniref:LacI family DNA-binding transcriptional regulator n=1 Tax=Candidatus Izemoplasma sp. B36 TaxID=3242468 RepID=UPI003556848E